MSISLHDSDVKVGSQVAGHVVLASLSSDRHGCTVRARGGRGHVRESIIRVDRRAGASVVTELRRRMQRFAAVDSRLCVPTDVASTDQGMVIIRPWFELTLTDGPLASGIGDRRLIEILCGLAETLEAIHGHALAHGSIRAGNVALRADGQPVLLDPAGHAGDASDDCRLLGRLGIAWIDELNAAAPAAAAGADDSLTRARSLCLSAADGDLGASALAAGLASLGDTSEPTSLARGADPTSATLRPPTPGRSVGARRTATAMLLLIVVAVAWAIVAAVFDDGRDTSAGAEVKQACSGSDDLAGAGREVVWADLYGEGCLRGVIWSSALTEAEIVDGSASGRYQLGRRGDHLLVGDWDNDGDAEPGLYRPNTGELFRWAGWAADGREGIPSEVTQTGVIGGEAVVVGTDGRHDVEIRGGSTAS